MTGLNQAKLLDMFRYYIEDCPMINESNCEKFVLWRISHANGNTKISSVETSVAKELALDSDANTLNTAKDIGSENHDCACTNKYVKEKGGGKTENFSNISWDITSNYGRLFTIQYTYIAKY